MASTWRTALPGFLAILACALPPEADGEPAASATQPATSAFSATNHQFVHVAVAGFELAAGADERDKWLPTAFEEMLCWRLRRVPGLLTVPVLRIHQARRELQEEGAAPPPWTRVIAAMGPNYMLTGRCAGPPFDATLHLAILEFAAAPGQCASRPSLPGAEPRLRDEIDLPAGKLFDVLDAATRWALERFEIHDLPKPLQRMILGPPCRSPSAVEYYARGIAAARANDFDRAYGYVTRSLDYDERFRPALALMAQLAIQAGPAQRNVAGQLLRQWAALSQIYEDPVDRAAAELGLGAVLHMEGSFDAAYERYETALAMAYANDSPYGQMIAASSLADLFLSRRLPPQPVLSEVQLQRLAEQDLRNAAAWQKIALDLASELGDVVTEAPCANKLALTYERLGDWDAAIAMHRRSLAAAQQVGSRQNAAAAWLCLAQACQHAGKAEDALAAGKRCLELARPDLRPMARIVSAGSYRMLGQPEAALAEYEQAYRKLRDSDDLGSQLVCARGIADLRMKLGRRSEAIDALHEAIEVAHALSATQDEAALRKQLSDWEQSAAEKQSAPEK